MPKYESPKPEGQTEAARREQARVAFESLVEQVHDDHRQLTGEELLQAILQVFEGALSTRGRTPRR